jgi:hypothetical protein
VHVQEVPCTAKLCPSAAILNMPGSSSSKGTLARRAIPAAVQASRSRIFWWQSSPASQSLAVRAGARVDVKKCSLWQCLAVRRAEKERLKVINDERLGDVLLPVW